MRLATVQVDPEQQAAFNTFVDFMLTGRAAGLAVGDSVGMVYKRTESGGTITFTGDVEYELKRLPDPNIYDVKVGRDRVAHIHLRLGTIEVTV